MIYAIVLAALFLADPTPVAIGGCVPACGPCKECKHYPPPVGVGGYGSWFCVPKVPKPAGCP